jgi:hypothetical protein
MILKRIGDKGSPCRTLTHLEVMIYVIIHLNTDVPFFYEVLIQSDHFWSKPFIHKVY